MALTACIVLYMLPSVLLPFNQGQCVAAARLAGGGGRCGGARACMLVLKLLPLPLSLPLPARLGLLFNALSLVPEFACPSTSGKCGKRLKGCCRSRQDSERTRRAAQQESFQPRTLQVDKTRHGTTLSHSEGFLALLLLESQLPVRIRV